MFEGEYSLEARKMNRNILLVCLGLAATVACAQQPRITMLWTNGTLTWSDAVTNGYYGVESVFDLTHMWTPWSTGTWNRASTTETASCALDLTMLNQIDPPTSEFATMLQHPFFRLVVSTNPLTLPSMTNMIQIINCSSASISNLVLGTVQNWVHTDQTTIPFLLPSQTTDWVMLTVPYVFEVWGMMSGYDSYYSDGGYIRYQQDGLNRSLEQPLILFGPARKEIIGIVSNTSITCDYTWLNLTGTRQW